MVSVSVDGSNGVVGDPASPFLRQGDCRHRRWLHLHLRKWRRPVRTVRTNVSSLSDATVSVRDQSWTGGLRPTATVTLGSATLVAGVDYIKYGTNKADGKATMTLMGSRQLHWRQDDLVQDRPRRTR